MPAAAPLLRGHHAGEEAGHPVRIADRVCRRLAPPAAL